jgi:hypothetical protein
MDLDVGDAVLEPGETLADLLLEPAVPVVVAVDLIVGMDLDVQGTLHRWQLVNAGRARLFPPGCDLCGARRAWAILPKWLRITMLRFR